MDVRLRPHLFVVIRSPSDFTRALCLWAGYSLSRARSKPFIWFDVILFCLPQWGSVWVRTFLRLPLLLPELPFHRTPFNGDILKTWQLFWSEHMICLLCWKKFFPKPPRQNILFGRGWVRKGDVAGPGWGGGCPLAVNAVLGRVASGPFQMPGHRPWESQSRLYVRGQLGTGRPPVQLWQQGPMEKREQVSAPVQTRPGSLEARQPALRARDVTQEGCLEATPSSHFYFQNEKGGTGPMQSPGGRGSSILLLHQAATCCSRSKPATVPWEGQALTQPLHTTPWPW